MAAPAAPAAAGGIRFKVYDLNTQNTRIDGVKPHPGDDLSPPFDPDAHTFLDVMAWRLDSHPDDRDRVWRVGPRNLIIGIDVSLDTPLRDWVAVLDLRTDGMTPAILRPTPIFNLSVAYEKVQYALAANAAGLAWPLWDAADTDPINMQAMGAHDNLRNRRGSMAVPPEEDNGIRNLIGLRRGRHLKFVNMHALAQSLVHGNRREPAFHTEIADIESFGRHLLIAMQRSTSPSASDPQHTLLPIIDLVTGAVDRRYGSAFSAYERRAKNKPLSEAAIRVANHGKEQGVAAGTYLARSVLGERMQMFMRENPNASLAEAEAEGLRLRDWIPATRDFSDADAMQIAREVHGRMSREGQLRNQRGIAAAAAAAAAADSAPDPRVRMVDAAYDALPRAGPVPDPNRVRNPLIEMYKSAFWAGGQEAAPEENARASLEAIRAGGIAPGAVRAFRRMLAAVGDIHVRYAGHRAQASHDERRAFMITAIHANYSDEEEAEEEEGEGEEPAAVNRLAARMERQLRW